MKTEAQLLKTNGYEQTTDTWNIMDVFQSIMLNEGCSMQKATYCVMILLIQEQESDQCGYRALGGVRDWIKIGKRKLLGVMEIFYTLILLVVSDCVCLSLIKLYTLKQWLLLHGSYISIKLTLNETSPFLTYIHTHTNRHVHTYP